MTIRNEFDMLSGAGETPASSALANARVVIVDDEPVNIALLERVLRLAGVTETHSVTDPRTAVSRCLEVDADLVLLDLQMPHVDGFTVMRDLREALPEETFLPILVLTADPTGPTRDRALAAGANDFLTKPFDRSEVLLRARNLLQTRALYAQIHQRNAALRADLEARAQNEHRLAEEWKRRDERVRTALVDGGLTMVFQPIAALDTGEVPGAEALARFHNRPARPPNEWFAEAASVGRGAELELAAVSAAIDRVGELPPETFLSVNVSASTAATPELPALLESAPASRIVLELTEHTRIDDYDALLTHLAPLRRRGVRLAVDDAGAGYSGLRHVLSLRPDILKLDIDLTRRIDGDPARRALATAMVSFSREIGAALIAEGVETSTELATLRALGVPLAQGYHLGRPAPLPLPEHVTVP